MSEIVYCRDCDEEYQKDVLIDASYSPVGVICPICGGYNFEE